MPTLAPKALLETSRDIVATTVTMPGACRLLIPVPATRETRLRRRTVTTDLTRLIMAATRIINHIWGLRTRYMTGASNNRITLGIGISLNLSTMDPRISRTEPSRVSRAVILIERSSPSYPRSLTLQGQPEQHLVILYLDMGRVIHADIPTDKNLD